MAPQMCQYGFYLWLVIFGDRCANMPIYCNINNSCAWFPKCVNMVLFMAGSYLGIDARTHQYIAIFIIPAHGSPNVPIWFLFMAGSYLGIDARTHQYIAIFIIPAQGSPNVLTWFYSWLVIFGDRCANTPIYCNIHNSCAGFPKCVKIVLFMAGSYLGIDARTCQYIVILIIPAHGSPNVLTWFYSWLVHIWGSMREHANIL